MKLDALLTQLFPDGHEIARGAHGTAYGNARLGDTTLAVIGIVDATPLGCDAALLMAGHVLDVMRDAAANPPARPILMLVDTASQKMARRDEMLGLNQYLAQICQALAVAGGRGHRTVGLLAGGAAAGAFIASALSTQTLLALPDAAPSVMDLPSIARVTKLAPDHLAKLAENTPVFAPGLAPITRMGGVETVLDPAQPLSAQLRAVLGQPAGPDRRDALGEARGGRMLAAQIAADVAAAACRDA